MAPSCDKLFSAKNLALGYCAINIALFLSVFILKPSLFWSGFTLCYGASAILGAYLLIRSAAPLEHLQEILLQLATSYQKVSVPTNYSTNTEFGAMFQLASQIGYNLDAINSTQAVIQFELDGTIIEANKNFLGAMGFELHEIQGKHHSMFAYGDFAQTDAYREFWQKLNQGVFFSGEFLRRNKNGNKIWIYAFYVPIYDLSGKPVRVVKFASDITSEVLQREQRAKEQKEFEMISLVASETDNLVVITDAQQRIEYVNNGFTRLTGYTPEEVIGKTPRIFQGKETTAEMKKEIREKIATKKPFYGEILNYTKSGAPYWVSLAINPVLNKNGDVERFISIQMDISEMKKQLIEDEEGQKETISVLKDLCEGNLTHRMTGEYKGTFGNIKHSLNKTIDQLGVIMQDISKSSLNMNDRSKNILGASDNLSGRTEAQAATLQEINATMTEVNSTVGKNAELASRSSEFAGEVRQTALNGGDVLKKLLGSMSDISESSERIVDIIGLIDTIASQTNLLALNAAVEAARAGEAGHGFAVVAGEVRTLAGRAAEASSDIRKLILENAASISSGSSLADNAGRSLDEIVESVSVLADQVNDIHKATNMQTTAIREISTALSSMDAATQQNSQMAVETSDIARELGKLGHDLDNHVNFFKYQDGQSLHKRSA